MAGLAEKSEPNKGRPMALSNMMDDNIIYSDTLHLQGQGTPSNCTAKKCMGSIMINGFPNKHPKLKNQTMKEALEFIREFYDNNKVGPGGLTLDERLTEVSESIENTGSYDLTAQELEFGSRTAWRNASRCVGRIQWSNLKLFDARHVTTAREMFDFLMKHLEYATNGGNLRSAITVFPQRKFGTSDSDFRIWNSLLIGYAGYQLPNGDFIGDRKSIKLTEICQKLGWKGKGGMFDVLPLVLQANGNDPEIFEIPEELALQVSISHPKYPALSELGLKWIAVPGVANMCFDCGGLEFTACQFSGWYMSTEIVRDLTDSARYNLLKPVTEKMDIPIGGNVTLWKDRTLLELSVAVLQSYQKSGVTLVDHHSASESFMTHMANEQKIRGGCPADWVWIVPPMSASLTEVFHQEMINYKLKPSYEYQADPWDTYIWKDEKLNKLFGGRTKALGKKMFQSLVKSTIFSQKLMGDALLKRPKCLIIYASETGRSLMFAEKVYDIFKKVFNAKLENMSECKVESLPSQQLIICVTSTFGNGDPPGNAKKFHKCLENVVKQDSLSDRSLLGHTFHAVFALGSRAYPKFCQFGHTMNDLLKSLGSTEIESIGEGDELQGQEETFQGWLSDLFKAVCREFLIDKDAQKDITSNLGEGRVTEEQIQVVVDESKLSLSQILSMLHGKPVKTCILKDRKVLQEKTSDRETLLLELKGYRDMAYKPGDHAAIFAHNDTEMVDTVLGRVSDCSDTDQVLRLEVKDESGEFIPVHRLPPCTLRQALTYLLDLKTPPTQALLKILAQHASNTDSKKISQLAHDCVLYQSWYTEHWYSLADVLNEFPSIQIPTTTILKHLPILTPRYYSISSSLEKYPGEIHLTVGLYNFTTGDGSYHNGLCSNWLKQIAINAEVPTFIREEIDFHLPNNLEEPVIMVGPGTGIAPFRSFWQQREMEASKGQKVGALYLYFGCRTETEGNLYVEETSRLSHVITQERRAFSRATPGKKVYVQNLLNEDSELIKDLLEQGVHIYICGGIQMAADVKKAIVRFLQKVHNISFKKAKGTIETMKLNGYYHEDIYGVNINTVHATRMASVAV